MTITSNFFFYIPNVSKSLLIVLGTSPLPANIWPWKVPPCGDRTLSQGLDKPAVCPHIPQPYYSYCCHSARHIPLSGRSNGADRAAKARPIRYPFFKRLPAQGPARRPSGGAPHVRAVRIARSRSDSVYVRIRTTIRDCERGS